MPLGKVPLGKVPLGKVPLGKVPLPSPLYPSGNLPQTRIKIGRRDFHFLRGGGEYHKRRTVSPPEADVRSPSRVQDK